MPLFVADIGGTNSRLALAEPTGRIGQAKSFRNDEFDSFYDVIARYFAEHPVTGLGGGCLAIAGPVLSDQARLTNRNWTFDSAAIAAALPVPPRRPVRLTNDIVALGHALSTLNGAQLVDITPEPAGAALNDQALVVGLGTGFNVCLIKQTAPTPVIFEAELGHACLPVRVAHALEAEIGPAMTQFETVEDLFSGTGLTRLHRVLSGGDTMQGQEIVSAYDAGQGGAVARTLDLSARLLGVLTRELVYQYLPFGGLHFAGGAARGILGGRACQVFVQAFAGQNDDIVQMGRVPLRLIVDDGAALTGAAQIALTGR